MSTVIMATRFNVEESLNLFSPSRCLKEPINQFQARDELPRFPFFGARARLLSSEHRATNILDLGPREHKNVIEYIKAINMNNEL
jgi:hypothetical protein